MPQLRRVFIMTMTRTRRRPLACIFTAATALTAAALITAAELPPQRARAQDGGAQPTLQATTADEARAGSSWCTRIPPAFGHPPANPTPVTLQVLQRSVEPVPATDGLIHLPYSAQATNTLATPANILSVVPVDPLADFAPTGRNFIIDEQGRDLAGKVRLFATFPDNTPSFTARVPAGNSGLMFFDVTYTDPAQVPHLLAHAITL